MSATQISRFLAIFGIVWLLTTSPAQSQNSTVISSPPIPAPPALRREMRGVWIATVDNIDWPSKPGLPVVRQKAELLDLLDRAKSLNLNAVFLQIRPAADAFYDSKIEPWSEFLSGEMGRAPAPFYDPLAFAIEAAHARGLELHAWFNPYRARFAGAKTPLSPDHIGRTRPDLVKSYGKLLWLDPGEAEVQELTTRVVLDVVRRYDIDGVHFDDYFYPYQELDAQNQLIPFPDEASFARYRNGGGLLNRDDWRRENVNSLVEKLNREIHQIKPYLRFGISPFGIWRPGFPAQIEGYDAYAKLYADARKWLQLGWVDYMVPQLYWKIEQTPQSFPVLLDWWTNQNPQNRHIWAGQFTQRAQSGETNRWPDAEIEYQIRITRGIAGASGNVHFSAKSLLRADSQTLPQLLAQGVYREAALVPASPWLSPPDAKARGELTLWRGTEGVGKARGGAAAVWLWVVQTRIGDKWQSEILPASQTIYQAPNSETLEEIAVSAVDRVGNQTVPERFDLAPQKQSIPSFERNQANRFPLKNYGISH